MTLWKRIVSEKCAVIIPLALAILVNVGVYWMVVYPLGVKSAGAADRADAAKHAVTAAEREHNAARALVTGKSRAEEELSTFYDKVLPANLTAARRLTYASLPELARKANVKYQASRYDPDPPAKDSRFARLHIRTVLQGEYENLRRFIYELESAPEFVIIDDVSLAQSDPGKPLVLTLEMSTYYRVGANGN
jgi:Type II secretion system (T2SS), protein M subtype b